MPTPYVYRILSNSEWSEMLRRDQFTGNAFDRRDGFIHLSTREQVPGTIAAHFADVTDGITIAEIDASLLRDLLRWEHSRDKMLFPHLYGALPLSAVMRTMSPDQFNNSR